MNITCLLGRLTATPEVRKTPNDVSVCSFTIAVDRYAGGEKKADFINCVAFNRNADNIARYFSKGNMIAINGNIQTRSYQDKEGKNRTVFEVLVDKFHFAGVNGGTSAQPTHSTPTNNELSTAALDNFSPVETDDGDLPF